MIIPQGYPLWHGFADLAEADANTGKGIYIDVIVGWRVDEESRDDSGVDFAGTQRAPLWQRRIRIGGAALAGVVLLASLYLMIWRATNDAPDRLTHPPPSPAASGATAGPTVPAVV